MSNRSVEDRLQALIFDMLCFTTALRDLRAADTDDAAASVAEYAEYEGKQLVVNMRQLLKEVQDDRSNRK